jgi:hypothetical protein
VVKKLQIAPANYSFSIYGFIECVYFSSQYLGKCSLAPPETRLAAVAAANCSKAVHEYLRVRHAT